MQLLTKMYSLKFLYTEKVPLSKNIGIQLPLYPEEVWESTKIHSGLYPGQL